MIGSCTQGVFGPEIGQKGLLPIAVPSGSMRSTQVTKMFKFFSPRLLPASCPALADGIP